MDTGVFVLTDTATLVPMRKVGFSSEDDFQALLAKYPALLVGDQIDSASPRRFILIAREQGIADQEGASDRWSVDHLFIDQDGIPTLVEVKRSTDTRIRREVIGQMLDYAANAVVHWPVQSLRDRFETRCNNDGIDFETVLADQLGWHSAADEFWKRVDTNLQAGKVRLLFVADLIPRVLRRVVEFLNGQMNPAEVLAIELRQYQGEGLRTLVPVVIGQTQAALQVKGVGPATRDWDETSFLASLAERTDERSAAVARRIVDWINRTADRVAFNKSINWAAISPVFVRPDGEIRPFALWADGSCSVQFEYMKGKPVFGELAEREELLRRLNQIPGIALPPTAVSGRKSMRLGALPDTSIDAYLKVMDWFVTRWRGTPSQDALPESTSTDMRETT